MSKRFIIGGLLSDCTTESVTAVAELMFGTGYSSNLAVSNETLRAFCNSNWEAPNACQNTGLLQKK
jgi:hypothetical protein